MSPTLADAVGLTHQTKGSQSGFHVRRCTPDTLALRMPCWIDFVERQGVKPLSRHPGWLAVLAEALGHQTNCIEALSGERIVGLLPLAYVKSFLFGRFLVGLPYLNTGGVLAEDDRVKRGLVDRAVELADALDVRFLELRHEDPIEHPAVACTMTSKVHMRLALPASIEELWKSFDPKVRNQIRKAEKLSLSAHWGSLDLVPQFYAVFSRNMRDLGTPVFGRRLFEAILRQFPERTEVCVVRQGALPIAAALLLHGQGVTEVPSASSLRSHNATNANMLLYWHLLQRAIQRGQQVFDFGRSSRDSNTFRFKKQWGAMPEPAVWQYHVRRGSAGDMRPDQGKYDRVIRIWRRLPVGLTRLLGPRIVRGIP